MPDASEGSDAQIAHADVYKEIEGSDAEILQMAPLLYMLRWLRWLRGFEFTVSCSGPERNLGMACSE